MQTPEPEAQQYRQSVALDEVMKAGKLFHGLQAHEITEIVARLQPVNCKRGERILERGIWQGRLYIIASGQVSVLLQDSALDGGTAFTTPGEQSWPGQDSGKREPSGAQSYIVTQLGPGECFGEMSLITGDPPSATVRAERDSVLWSLTHLDFMALISACPTLLSNINAILAQRLARMNRHIGPAHTAEKVWLALVEKTGAPLERSLAFHIADALALRSRKRVLLVDMGEQDALLASHFATHSDQVRPSLLECARDPASLRKHQAPTVTSADRHYPAITTLLALSTPQVGGGSESGDFDIRSILRDLAKFYDYLLLVTTGTTPPSLIETVAGNCARAVLLISSDAVGREGESAAALPLTSGSEALPYSICIAHVPEHPTIGVQDRYARRLGRSVTRLLPADTPLLEESWERRIALSEAAPHSVLTRAVDFVARHIAQLTVGIAFGGGGARGFAHLGAFERLLHYGIPVDYLAGCSIGTLPPSLYLMGKSFAESEALFLDIQHHVIRWGFPRMSIFSNRGLKRELQKRCGDLRFEDLLTPLAMIALDLTTRKEVVLDRGPLWLAVLASISIPGIFPPVTIGNHMLIDAGVHDPVPTRAVRKMGADILLSIDVDDREPLSLESATPWMEEANYTLSRKSLSPHMVDVLLRAYEVSVSTINMHSDLEADVVIRPQTRSVSLLQFTRGPHLVAEGREAVEQSLPALRALFPWL
ncbi:MAG: patatin-like phospholipase family protein [Ktedonobacteraceae bacterium]